MKMRSKVLWLLMGASVFTASAALAATTYNATAVTYQGDGAGTISAGAPVTGSISLTPTAGPTLAIPASVLQQTAVLTYTVNGGAVQLGGTGAVITAGNATTAYLNANPTATAVPFQASVVQKLTTTTNNAAGSFGPGGGQNGGFGGALSTGANAVVNTFVFLGAWQPLNINLPLSVIGSGGMATAPLTIFGSSLGSIVVTGQKWTTGALSGTSSGGSSFAVTGTNTLTPNGNSGSVTLVTAFTVNVNAAAPQQRVGYATLTLAAVPEPGTLLLLGAGLAGLVAVGRRRRS